MLSGTGEDKRGFIAILPYWQPPVLLRDNINQQVQQNQYQVLISNVFDTIQYRRAEFENQFYEYLGQINSNQKRRSDCTDCTALSRASDGSQPRPEQCRCLCRRGRGRGSLESLRILLVRLLVRWLSSLSLPLLCLLIRLPIRQSSHITVYHRLCTLLLIHQGKIALSHTVTISSPWVEHDRPGEDRGCHAMPACSLWSQLVVDWRRTLDTVCPSVLTPAFTTFLVLFSSF